jgi:hypothetical protein
MSSMAGINSKTELTFILGWILKLDVHSVLLCYCEDIYMES